jgi:uncharacterized membrane protein
LPYPLFISWQEQLMTGWWLITLTFGTALGCGLIAGVFFAFSAFVMKALVRLPAPQAIAAMQSINVVAVTPLFMTALFGTAAACLLLTVLGGLPGQQRAGVYLIAGSVSYLVGTIAVTIFFNVPQNEKLAAVDPASAEGVRLWTEYSRSWTAWNHVRTIAALIAAACISAGLWQR